MEHIIVSNLMKHLDIQNMLFFSSMAFVEITLANLSLFPFSRNSNFFSTRSRRVVLDGASSDSAPVLSGAHTIFNLQ